MIIFQLLEWSIFRHKIHDKPRIGTARNCGANVYTAGRTSPRWSWNRLSAGARHLVIYLHMYTMYQLDLYISCLSGEKPKRAPGSVLENTDSFTINQLVEADEIYQNEVMNRGCVWVLLCFVLGLCLGCIWVKVVFANLVFWKSIDKIGKEKPPINVKVRSPCGEWKIYT